MSNDQALQNKGFCEKNNVIKVHWIWLNVSLNISDKLHNNRCHLNDISSKLDAFFSTIFVKIVLFFNKVQLKMLLTPTCFNISISVYVIQKSALQWRHNERDPSLVTPKIFPFDDVIMGSHRWTIMSNCGVVAYYILVYVELKARIRKYWVNSFWPSDIIWRHRSLSALIRSMGLGWLIVNCNLLKEKQICEILM